MDVFVGRLMESLDMARSANAFYLVHFSALSQLVTVLVALLAIKNWFRLRRCATIFVVNADDPQKPPKKIARVAARFLSRAEVNGVISQRSSIPRLDFSQSKFDYSFRREIKIALPDASYEAVTGI